MTVDAYKALLDELRRERAELSQTISVLERQQQAWHRRRAEARARPAIHGIPLLQQIERLIAGGINERLAHGQRP